MITLKTYKDQRGTYIYAYNYREAAQQTSLPIREVHDYKIYEVVYEDWQGHVKVGYMKADFRNQVLKRCLRNFNIKSVLDVVVCG